MRRMPGSRWPTGRGFLVAFAFGGGVAYLAIVLGVTLLVGPSIPRAGWLLFLVVVAVVVGLCTGAAAFLVHQSRTAGAGRPRAGGRQPGAEPCILVVAERGCEDPDACGPLATYVAGRHADVFVIAPALASATRYLDSDTDRASAKAGDRLTATIAALAASGIEAQGMIGSENPLEAIADAYAQHPADEIVIASAPDIEASWLERDVVRRARGLYDVPVSHVVLDRRPTTSS